MSDVHAVAHPNDALQIDSVPGLVAILSPAGEVDAVNEQLVQYCGQPLEAMRQWGTNGIVHPDDVPRIAPLFMDAIAAGIPYDFDARVRRFDGVYRWYRVRGRPLKDRDGHIARWYSLLNDIDDRKNAETLLAGEKRLLELVAHGATMPAILDGICRFVESAGKGWLCSVLLVHASDARLAQGAAPSLPDSYGAAISGALLSADAGPSAMAASLNEQVIVEDLAADRRWSEAAWRPGSLALGLRACWSTPIPSTTGEVLGTLTIYRNEPGSPTPRHRDLIEQLIQVASIAIERTQEAEALKRSEALLSRVQQMSNTGGFYLWPASGKGYWSDEVYRIHEMEPGTPIPPEVRQSLIHPEDLPALLRSLQDVVREERDFEYDVRLLLPSGTVKYVHLMMHPTRDAEGALLYVGAVQDVTAWRRSEAALSRLRAELTHMARVTTLGALTASIAHEVNQPLSGIITNASTCLRMLGADPPNVDGARQTAQRTLRDGNRAADVIRKLRALFGGQETAPEPLDLNTVAREVLVLSRGDLDRDQVVLRTVFASGLPPVQGDRVQIQQVILNFLRNALDAMRNIVDRPRTLLVETRLDEGGQPCLSVTDAGPGFPSEVADKLFDSFFTTKPDGMGMGLSVSRSIIERHQGRIWATLNQGPGATFAFTLPTDTMV